MARLKIDKTIKLFIGGKFPRTESGRTYVINDATTDKPFAHLCQASRKDLRVAVDAGVAARNTWGNATPFLRSQIIYRMAEMAEGKRGEFFEVLTKTMGFDTKSANQNIDEAIDALVYYAGFADKFQQVSASVNPVASAHHNFTTAEATGLVAHICDEDDDLHQIITHLVSIICSGNTAITVLPQEAGALLAPLAEVFATSDLPAGAVNLLTGVTDELVSHLSGHMEINAICCQTLDEDLLGTVKELAVPNMKRVSPPMGHDLGLDSVLRFVEYKTVWHPIGV